ncbi:MAG: cell division protein ZapA [Oscillospiraceae bacterium]
MINRVKIEILGTSYTIATPEDDAYVRALARALDQKLSQTLEANPKMSPMSALLLCALDGADAYKKSEESADHMRSQLTDYLEDAAKARIELDDAKRELERLRRQLSLYQEKDKRG